MKNIYFILIISTIFLVAGCKEKKEKEKKGEFNSTKIETPLIIHQENKKEQDDKKILNKIGISKNGEKIIIDTNKTKVFFENMAKILTKEAQRLEEKTKNLDSSDLGINLKREKIEIDINKTKSFLEQFSKELEGIAKDIDRKISN